MLFFFFFDKLKKQLIRFKKSNNPVNKTVDGGLFGGSNVGKTEAGSSFGSNFADGKNL